MPPFLPSATTDFSEQPARNIRSVAAVQSSTPASAVLALQRSHGNRRVARSVSQRLARQPAPAAPATASAHVPWVQQTTAENRALAQEIDELERLDMEEYRRRRAVTEMRASDPSDAHWEQYKLAQDAFEFIEARRIAPMRVRRELLDETYDGGPHKIRSRNVRVVIEQGIQESGSLRKSIKDMRKGKGIENDIFFIEHDADEFGRHFTSQAREFARLMLAQSAEEILTQISRYGLRKSSALYAANRILDGEERSKVVRETVNASAVWDADEDAAHKPSAALSNRASLGGQVTKLREQQRVVLDLREQLSKQIKHVRGDIYIPDGEAFKAAQRRVGAAEARLSAMWLRAERAHKVLAAFRPVDKSLADADLSGLDDGSFEDHPQMTAVLSNLLQKLADIGTIQHRIKTGNLSPCSLPPVVAVTKAAMFVPPGSIREGKVNDLAEDAEDSGVAKYIAEGLLALMVIAALIPSGGASLGVAIGLTSAALSATSAVEDWETYKKHKLLANTNIDRAKALSTEEPSLLPFAVDLISLGLDGAPLVKAFRNVVALRNLVRARQEIESADLLKQLLTELDGIGATKGESGLGKQVLKDLQAGEQDAKTAAHGAAGDASQRPSLGHPKPPAKPPPYEPTPPQPRSTPHPKPPAKPPAYEPQPPPRASSPHPKPPARPMAAALHPPPGSRYTNELALRSAIERDLAKLDFAEANTEWVKLENYLKDNPDALHPDLLRKIQRARALTRNKRKIVDDMVSLWASAAHGQTTEEEALARFFGGRDKLSTVVTQDEEIFRRRMLGQTPIVDQTPGVVESRHGALIHVFHEYMLARAWGREEARAFIQEMATYVERVNGGDRLYSVIWNALFDEFEGNSPSNAENLGEILIRRLGFEGKLPN